MVESLSWWPGTQTYEVALPPPDVVALRLAVNPGQMVWSGPASMFMELTVTVTVAELIQLLRSTPVTT